MIPEEKSSDRLLLHSIIQAKEQVRKLPTPLAKNSNVISFAADTNA